ncbi:MAG: hypothetical protein ACOVRB_00305 [Akkermansiaceae bacterium]|jgi:hypothetical protein
MNFPLSLRFKLLALSPQIYVSDAAQQPVLYVKQKLFKLREKIEVFRDESRSQLLCTIQANKIIDWSARYFFTAADGSELGSVGRKGMRSLWRAHYEVFAAGDSNPDFVIREENPWTKVADSFFGELPLIGMFAGYLFHPRYLVTRKSTGQPVFRLSKQSALWEGKFLIEKFGDSTEQEETALTLSLLMLILLEKRRG